MRQTKRVLTAAFVVLACSAVVAGVVPPASATVIAAPASSGTARTVTATVSEYPYSGAVTFVFPGFEGPAPDSSKAVISVPANSTRVTFDLGADAARLRLSTIDYWTGTVNNFLNGSVPLNEDGRTVTIDVPVDTFVEGATDAFFDLEVTAETVIPGAVIPPAPTHGPRYDFYAVGGLAVTAPAPPQTIELPPQKAESYSSYAEYGATVDSTQLLTVGDQVVLSTGRPGFFVTPSPTDGVPRDVIQDWDQTVVPLTSVVSGDASSASLAVTQDAVDTLGGRPFSRLVLSDERSRHVPRNDQVQTTISVQVLLADPKSPASYVIALYQDYVDRAPAESEIQGWVLSLINGYPRTIVAAGFVNSDEYRLDRIDNAYRTVLGREPDGPGRLSWLHGMQQGLLTPDDIETSFYASTEYFQQHGGTNASWAAALYTTLLNRSGTPSDYTFWGDLAAQHGRAWVIAQFWDSTETISERVTAMYQRYLGRQPDAGGLAAWVSVALHLGDSGLRAALTSSDEYFARSQIRYPQR